MLVYKRVSCQNWLILNLCTNQVGNMENKLTRYGHAQGVGPDLLCLSQMQAVACLEHRVPEKLERECTCRGDGGHEMLGALGNGGGGFGTRREGESPAVTAHRRQLAMHVKGSWQSGNVISSIQLNLGRFPTSRPVAHGPTLVL